MEPIKTEQVGPFTVELHHDTDPVADDPRTWANVGTIVLPDDRQNHRRSTALGTEEREYQDDDGVWHTEDLEPGDDGYGEALAAALDAVVLVPLWFDDRVWTVDDWADANAYAYATAADLSRMGYDKLEDVSPEAAAYDAIEHEVRILSDWLTGEVYGWVVTGPDGAHVNSCWGHIGEPDYAWSEAVDAAKHAHREHSKAPAERVIMLDEVADQLPDLVTYEGTTYRLAVHEHAEATLTRYDGPHRNREVNPTTDPDTVDLTPLQRHLVYDHGLTLHGDPAEEVSRAEHAEEHATGDADGHQHYGL